VAQLLHLGYASFVYVVDKDGYKVQCHARNHITIWHNDESPDKGEYEPYQVKNKGNSDCGCLVINAIVFNERFGSGSNKIKYFCQREFKILLDKSQKIEHCETSLREEVCTPISNGETVRCLNK